MAIKIPIITELQDEGIKRAKREFDKFKGAVAGAEGGMGKFKAGSKVVMDGIAANAATFATAAAGAFVTFAAKGVTAFQDLALSADKFAGATGLAVEEASRLMEVTGDLGIEAGTVETAIGKMNQNLGKSPDLFEELGVQVEYAKDGTVDANETFLNVIDRLNKIKDPATKARVATQLLGKGWRDMSNLIQMGADDLRKSLSQVSGAKTISAEEAEKARKFRDTMDQLGDAVSDLGLMLGEVLVPLLTKAAEILTSNAVKDFFGGLKAGWKFLTSPITNTYQDLKRIGDEFKTTGDMLWYTFFGDPRYKGPVVHVEAMKAAREEAKLMRDEFRKFQRPEISEPFEKLRTNAERLKNELQNVADKWDLLTGKLDQTVAFDEAAKQLQIVESAAMEAFGTDDADLLSTYNATAADLVKMLQGIASEMGNISSRAILMRFELQGPRAALDLAEWLAGGAEYGNLSMSQRLGEAGLSIGAPLPPLSFNAPSRLERGGFASIVPTNNITINTSADPNAVVDAIQRWTRNNGAIPLATTTNIRR